MRKNLGIGHGGEAMPSIGELALERQIVFDDAVVNHGDLAGAIRMWVSVGLGRPAMGRPTRVPKAAKASEGLSAEKIVEVGELAHAARNADGAVGDDRHAGRVVAAVLEPF